MTDPIAKPPIAETQSSDASLSSDFPAHITLQDRDLNQEIADVLARPDPTSSGKVRIQRSDSDGGTIEHRFSWGLGMLRQSLRKRYRAIFGHDVPAWLGPLHPAKEARILGYAIEQRRRVPAKPPAGTA